MERRLIEDYRALVMRDRSNVSMQANLAAAIELAHAASEIGGYGPVKDASIASYEAKLPKLLAAFDSTVTLSQPRAA